MSGNPIDSEHHSARHNGEGENDVRLLESMGLDQKGTPGGKDAFKQYNNHNVWKMLMAEDAEEGEGRVIWNDDSEHDGLVESKESQDGEVDGKPLPNGSSA
jgi:hypothetical protein